MKEKMRCAWADSHELMVPYHDQEWGVPVHDDRLLFEMLNLEGAQAGLSWLTVLKKRDAYLKAFDHFNAKKIVKYSAAKRAHLMKNEGIIRNRLKIHAVVENAKAFLDVQREFGSFDAYIWQFVDGKTIRGTARKVGTGRAGEQSHVMSKALKARGFRFVGPTICYAFMQAVGMVDDHSKNCFKYKSK